MPRLTFTTLFSTPALGLVAGCLLSLTAPANAETPTTLDDQTAVAVTIYNQNLALVKDRRELSMEKGTQKLAFRGVSALMRPETALLRNTESSDALRVLEQNFDFDLLTPQKLLEKNLGRKVRIATVNPATGREKVEEAEILSVQNGTVVRIGDRIETNPPGRFIFSELPPNLRDEPTLSVALNSNVGGKQSVEMSYLTGGLSWKADYVAEISQDDKSLDITGWVTLDNASGATYNNAKLQLVAGDVNQVAPAMQMRNKSMMMETMAASADQGMAQETLFEYHLYTLGRPTTIREKQKKQVSLMSAGDVKAKKELVLQGQNYYYSSRHNQIGQRVKFGVYLQFENEEENSMGIPLPKGIVRVYKRDTNGNAQFVGEDNIDHTANKESVRLKLGNAFDVTANKKQTNFKVQDRILGNSVFDSSFEIEVNNAKKETVEVIVREPIPGDWEMLRESLPHKKVSSGMAEWRIQVPALGSKTLSFTTRVKY